jgi:predicted HicB family RNase H-like nuclease
LLRKRASTASIHDAKRPHIKCTHNLHKSFEQTNEISVLNISFTVDEQIAQSAREAAQKMGKSLNQVVLDYL